MSSCIETSRLILRPLSATDNEALVLSLNNFNVSQHTARIPFPYSIADADDFLAVCAATEPGSLRFAITRKDRGDMLCGVIGYERCADGRSAEIGYWIAEADWRQGFGTEAARAMTGHAFGPGGYARLVAGYRHGNDASRRILKHLGFVKTGEVQNYSRALGAAVPVTRLALIREDWFK